MDAAHALIGSFMLWLTVSFGGVRISCLADTGSAYTILRVTQAAYVGTLQPLPGMVTLYGISGTPVSAWRAEVPSVETPDMGWGRSEVLIVPDAALPVPCLMGMNLLRQQPITIDWQGGTIVPALTRSSP